MSMVFAPTDSKRNIDQRHTTSNQITTIAREKETIPFSLLLNQPTIQPASHNDVMNMLLGILNKTLLRVLGNNLYRCHNDDTGDDKQNGLNFKLVEL